MPVYTYRCENCGIQFDEREGFDDPTKTICPECDQESLHRVYLPVGIVFKGSGFYATDNRSPSGQKDSRKPKDDEKKTETTSESKPAEAKSAEPATKNNGKKETEKK